MKIKEVKLKQFKRFTNLTINLGDNPRKVIAMVGPNGSGKSSVFDAFEEKQKTYKGANYNPTVSFLSKLLHFISGEENNKYDRSRAVKILKEDGTENFDKKSFYIRTSYRFTPRLNITEIKQQQDALDDTSRPGSSTEIDVRMRENYERMIGTAWDEFWNEDGNGKTGKVTREELTGKINTILGEILDMAAQYRKVGRINYLRLGRYKAARTSFTEANTIYRELGDLRGEGARMGDDAGSKATEGYGNIGQFGIHCTVTGNVVPALTRIPR